MNCRIGNVYKSKIVRINWRDIGCLTNPPLRRRYTAGGGIIWEPDMSVPCISCGNPYKSHYKHLQTPYL